MQTRHFIAAGFACLLLVLALQPDTHASNTLTAARPSAVIRAVFGARAGAALHVAYCESHMNPRAVSPTGDYGLFQANYRVHHWRGESTWMFARRHFNVAYHVRWAYRLSRGGTWWGPWELGGCAP